MRNFPKHLNSKADYEYIRGRFPRAKWLPYWKALLNHQEWFVTGALENKASGIEDATHRIREDITPAMMSADGKEKVSYTQEELRDNPAHPFFALGFTQEEVEEALAEGVAES